MIYAAVSLICIAVVLGGFLLYFVLYDKHPPKGLVFAHGSCAILGIVLLLIYALTTEEHHKHWDSIIIFAIAAVGGLYLLSKDIRHKKVPKGVAVVHGSIALFGFIWLLSHLFH